MEWRFDNGWARQTVFGMFAVPDLGGHSRNRIQSNDSENWEKGR